MAEGYVNIRQFPMFKLSVVNVPDLTIGNQGWIAIPDGCRPVNNISGYAHLITVMSGGASQNKVCFSITNNGQYVVGTAGDVISTLKLVHIYVPTYEQMII